MNPEITSHHQQALKAINSGDYRSAEQHCLKILRLDKNFADAHFLIGMAAAGTLQVGKALLAVEHALKLAPDNAEYLAQHAKLCALVNRFDPAEVSAQAALKQNDLSALTLDTLGVVFTKLGNFESARDALARAVAKLPKNHQFHFNLASAEQFLGNETAAAAHYEKALSLNPEFARAEWALSELRKVHSSDELTNKRIDALQNKLPNADIDNGDQLYLAHALSRELERTDDYSQAFEVLAKAKFRHRAGLNYSWKVDERLFDAIKQTFPLPATPVDTPLGENVIFVLGMPRSGTTLTERILSSHSRVDSFGELQNLSIAVKRASQTKTQRMLDETVLAKADQLDFAAVGQDYLASLTGRIKPDIRFIDKMPLNFLYLGYIKHALPAAKIICLKRHPLDTCISNFRQLFGITFTYYNYHYDLVDTAQYIRLFDELMRYWKELFPTGFHEVEYETLVAEPEPTVRAMLKYCGLDFEQACLDFHENKSAVATASTMQVRQPLYTSAVNRWQRYDDQLAPAKEVFDEFGIKY
ncbi:MAG: sulfotransferase [Pseudomonadota bacterium]